MADHSKRSSSGRVSHRTGRASSKKTMPAGQVRIVAGRWRGRKLSVVHADGLRPTGDRVRETVFNWLQMQVPGSHCLDLFAGSGALGLEAASRGAASVVLVESDDLVASQLRSTLTTLAAGDDVQLHVSRAEQYLATKPGPFDIVFIDPPFDADLHADIVAQLVPDTLAEGAFVYLELPTRQSKAVTNLPRTLSTVKEKRFGDVTVFLLRYSG